MGYLIGHKVLIEKGQISQSYADTLTNKLNELTLLIRSLEH